jgi:heme exporter protein D
MNFGLDLGPHAAFIWTAYAITALVLAGLIVWLVAEGRTLKARLDELAARGITRRSEGASVAPPKS